MDWDLIFDTTVRAAFTKDAIVYALVSGLRTSAPAGLRWSAVRLEEGHASVYHPAVRQAFRTLYRVLPASTP